MNVQYARDNDSTGDKGLAEHALFQGNPSARRWDQIDAAKRIGWHRLVRLDCDIADGLEQYWLGVVLTVFVSCAAVDIDSVHVAAVRIPAKQGPT